MPQVQKTCDSGCLARVYQDGHCKVRSHFRHVLPSWCHGCLDKATELCHPRPSRRRSPPRRRTTMKPSTTAMTTTTTTTQDCQTAVQGDDCFPHVIWALQTGIHMRPDWYRGLNTTSTFEDFQLKIHETVGEVCPKPCPPVRVACKAAQQGDECHKHVTWAMEVGIKMMPQTYSGLSAESTFDDFQDWMYRMHHGRCLAPSCRDYMS